jgi:hypothetical protein
VLQQRSKLDGYSQEMLLPAASPSDVQTVLGKVSDLESQMQQRFQEFQAPIAAASYETLVRVSPCKRSIVTSHMLNKTKIIRRKGFQNQHKAVPIKKGIAE